MLSGYAIDPVLPHVLAGLLAIVLIAGAWQKARDIDGFAGALSQYRLLPDTLSVPAAYALIAAEAGAGTLLLPLTTRAHGAGLALALIAVVTAAVVINLLRGRRAIDCGCGSPGSGQQLSWALVARNAALALAAWLALTEEGVRELVWIDRLTLLAGTLALYGVYAAADQLIANWPRLAKLRGDS